MMDSNTLKLVTTDPHKKGLQGVSTSTSKPTEFKSSYCKTDFGWIMTFIGADGTHRLAQTCYEDKPKLSYSPVF